MKASDLVSAPFQAGAAIRHRRLFHPIGVLADGSVERTAPPGEGLPVESGSVVGRISKGVGTPGALPDFAGLAWRMHPAPFAATPWDVLLVSAGLGSAGARVNRLLLRPVASWSGADYSSLTPLCHDGQLWWIRGRLATEVGRSGLSLSAIRDGIGAGGLRFDIEQACGGGEFAPLASLRFDRLITGDDVRSDITFDPVRHTSPDVTVWPAWLRELRELAYRGSRQGRHAG